MAQPVTTARFNMKKAIYTLISLFLWSGCAPDQEAKIQEKVAEKVNDFIVKEEARCHTELLARAEKIVDSILLAEAQLQIRDSLLQGKPYAPAQPPAVPPLDTLEVKPIFPKKG